MTTDPRTAVSLKDRAELARIGGDIQHLLVADGAWTEYAKRNRREDMEDLGSLVEQMDAVLERLSQDGDFLVRLVRDIGEEGLDALLFESEAAQMAPEKELARVRDIVANEGGALSMAEQRFGTLESALSRDRKDVKDEYERLREGHDSEGDIGAGCAAAMAEAVAGALTFPVGAGLYVGGLIGMDASCPG